MEGGVNLQIPATLRLFGRARVVGPLARMRWDPTNPFHGKAQLSTLHPLAARLTDALLLQNVIERLFGAEAGVVNIEVLQNRWADRGHSNAVKIHPGPDSRSPSDEGCFESFPKW